MRHIITIIILFGFNSLTAAEIATGQAAKNALYQHASPYLAMHGRDPVRWQEWNAKTIARAKKEKKLLFVSSGYFSCHWCHVMQRESYQNKAIADLLNQNFIPVKVDRELNSALDAHLIDFVQRTQGISGWPLNTFVTPEGFPLAGMVYVPAENFKQILNRLNNEWNSNRDSLQKLAKAASEELSPVQLSTSHQLPEGLASKLIHVYLNQIFSRSDDLQGGFGQENKFPSVPQLDALLDIYSRQPRDDIKKFLVVTLKQMASQGLRDQLGGGFYRYAVDPGWQVPHFEKMLYDNALLTSLYYKAGDLFNEPYYTAVADNTLEFVLREFGTREGAMTASLSAIDEKGKEGGYYLWDTKQLANILNKKEWQVIKRFWQLEGPPDLDDGHHLVQVMSIRQVAEDLQMKQEEVTMLIKAARTKMLTERGKRKLPEDNKILTAWNGLTLSALVSGVRHTQNTKYKQAAAGLANFIRSKLWNGKQLSNAVGPAGSLGKGNLEDYAYTIQGLYDWWRLTKSRSVKPVLDSMIGQAWERFYSKQGWLLAEDMLLRYGQGESVIADGVLPSSSAVLVKVSYQYARITGNEHLRKRALRALNNGHDQLKREAFWFASQIAGIASLP